MKFLILDRYENRDLRSDHRAATGKIAQQADCEAVVNAANAKLETGGGVAGAIHRAAGPGLADEARPLGPLKPGEAVITGAHLLPNNYVIHCLGPVYGKDKSAGPLLASCYSRALDLAEQEKVTSIAFPAISTGIFGYPVEEAGMIAFTTILEEIPRLKYVTRIVYVLYSTEDLEMHKHMFAQLLQGRSN